MTEVAPIPTPPVFRRRDAAACLAALLATAVPAVATEARPPRYAQCNVMLQDACFGIARGDAVLVREAGQGLAYEVTFSFGRRARVYAGPRPEVGPDDLGSFQACERPNGFGECRLRRFANGALELVARRDAQADYVHVVISRGLGSEASVHSFLRNVRACTRSGASTTCAPA